MSKVDLSIIIPVYFNEGSLKQLTDEIFTNISKIDIIKYEIIFVDDGSGDKSFETLREIYKNYQNIKVIKLSKNFGQVNATLAGYSIAKGNAVITMSADLQDPTELITSMYNYYCNEQTEIVICERQDREDKFFVTLSSKVFYWLMRVLSFNEMPKGGFDYFLISDRVKNVLINNPERNMFLQGNILSSGFKIKRIPYIRKKRLYGTSRWTFSKKVKALLDSVLAFSYFPVRLMSLIGLIISLLGFLYAISIAVSKIFDFGEIPFTGWAPIMILVLVLSGIQMLMLGIIGEYLWRTLDQVRKRPHYIIDKIYE